MQKPLFIILDGSNLFYSKGKNQLRDKHGRPTGHILGITDYIEQLHQKEQPEALAVVFDLKEPTFRHEIYPEYKAGRTPMTDELVAQVAPMKALLTALGYELLSRSGFEADDVMGSLLLKALGEGYRVKLISGDKDMGQLLINDDVVIVNGGGEQTLSRNDCPIKPHLLADYLALKGDKVDNIIGVKNINQTTLVKALLKYNGLKGLLENRQQITGALGKQLNDDPERFARNLTLTTLKTDLDFDFKIADLTRKAPNLAEISAICDEYGLHKLKGNYLAPSNETLNYRLIADLDELSALIADWQQLSEIGFDIETTGLDPFNDEIVGFSFAPAEKSAFYLPCGHRSGLGLFEAPAPENIHFESALKLLKPLLENPAVKKIGHHLKFDRQFLKRFGLNLKGTEDTLLMSYVYHSTATKHNLDALARYYLNHHTVTYEDLVGKGVKALRFDQVPVTDACFYACEDADITLRLFHYFSAELTEPLKALYRDLELPLSDILAEMEYTGVKIDVADLNAQSRDLEEALLGINQTIEQQAGSAFNPNSPKQLREILFDRLKLPVIKKTPTGEISTDESVLSTLAEEHELPRLILDYRSLAKLKSTYTDALPTMINPKTGRIHTHYNQALTSTGRLSSSNPNLQNIPIKTPVGQKIRQAFITDPNWTMVAGDYSQIELRIMAHFADETTLKSAFAHDLDVHSATAREIFGTEEVNKEQRRYAKTINFGLIYGMSAFGLAKNLKIEIDEADAYIKRYFERYPKVLDYMERTKDFARTHGFVETLLGRRIYVPEINNKNKTLRQEAERLAINAPIQGSAADLMKLAMMAVHRLQNHHFRMLMQVHDEVIWEIQNEHLEALLPEIQRAMEQVYELSVPLKVEMGAGRSWLHAH